MPVPAWIWLRSRIILLWKSVGSGSRKNRIHSSSNVYPSGCPSVGRTIEGGHVHGDGFDEALALVELPLQQLAEHVERDELVAVEDGALRESAASGGTSTKHAY